MLSRLTLPVSLPSCLAILRVQAIDQQHVALAALRFHHGLVVELAGRCSHNIVISLGHHEITIELDTLIGQLKESFEEEISLDRTQQTDRQDLILVHNDEDAMIHSANVLTRCKRC